MPAGTFSIAIPTGPTSKARTDTRCAVNVRVLPRLALGYVCKPIDLTVVGLESHSEKVDASLPRAARPNCRFGASRKHGGRNFGLIPPSTIDQSLHRSKRTSGALLRAPPEAKDNIGYFTIVHAMQSHVPSPGRPMGGRLSNGATKMTIKVKEVTLPSKTTVAGTQSKTY